MIAELDEAGLAIEFDTSRRPIAIYVSNAAGERIRRLTGMQLLAMVADAPAG